MALKKVITWNYKISELKNYRLIWQEAQKEAKKELLEEIREDMKNVHMINIDKYIDRKLKKLN